MAHTNYFKCGLCERNLDDSEKLGTHLNTCEMFVAEDATEMKQPPQISKITKEESKPYGAPLCFFRYFEVAPLQSQISHLNVPIV